MLAVKLSQNTQQSIPKTSWIVTESFSSPRHDMSSPAWFNRILSAFSVVTASSSVFSRLTMRMASRQATYSWLLPFSLNRLTKASRNLWNTNKSHYTRQALLHYHSEKLKIQNIRCITYKCPVKVSQSQMVLQPSYPHQLSLSKATRYGWDFVPYCISNKF